MERTLTTTVGFLDCDAPEDLNGVYQPFQTSSRGDVFVWQVQYIDSNMTDIPLFVRSAKSNSSAVLGSTFQGNSLQGYEDGDWIELVGEQGYVMKNGSSGVVLVKIGITGFWRLQCFSGYSPEPSTGDFAFCHASGLLSQPQPSCVRDKGCNGAVVPVHSNARTGCAQWMPEGASCKVECSEDFTALGSFTCSRGEMIGQSACFEKNKDVIPDSVRRVAGTIRMLSKPEPNESQVSKALAFGLLLPESSIVHLRLKLVPGERRLKGGRRLASDLFRVKYEIDVPHDVMVVLWLCHELARADSTVQRRFRNEMLSRFGMEVSDIETVIAAREITSVVFKDSNGTELLLSGFEKPTPESGFLDRYFIELIVGASVALLSLCVCCCAVQYYFLMQRKANA
jgi:hypothetical protein